MGILKTKTCWGGKASPLVMRAIELAGHVGAILTRKPVLSADRFTYLELTQSETAVEKISGIPAINGSYHLYALMRDDAGGGRGDYHDLVSFRRLGRFGEADAKKIVTIFSQTSARPRRDVTIPALKEIICKVAGRNIEL